MDYPFAGALVYEFRYVEDPDNIGYVIVKCSYTGEKARPVYDPAVVKPLVEAYKQYDKYDPSRPVRVVLYKPSVRTESEDLDSVYFMIIPLDILDQPNIGADKAKNEVGTLLETDLFDGGNASCFFKTTGNWNDLDARPESHVRSWVWFTD
jgi:hypothetical protein